MILTCPECATSYFVDDARIPSQGRRVKCSSCGHRWIAGPEAPIPAALPAAGPPEPEAPAEAQPPPAARLGDELEITGPEVIPIPRPSPTDWSAQPPRSQARSSAILWAGVAAAIALAIAGAVVFREEVVRLWPGSSAAYAGLGFPVSSGLTFEQVRAAPTFIGGRPALSVTGAIRNTRDRPAAAPPIRVSLLDRHGKPVSAKIARPIDASIPANSRRHFVVAILDPPNNASELEVRFETRDGRPGPRAAAALLAPPRGPAAPSAGSSTSPAATAPPVLTEHG